MKQPENQSKKYEHLFAGIDQGNIKIPMFQRDFVWGDEQTASLIDSIIKGFPIGTFILWKTREEMRHIKNVGNAELPESPKGDTTLYVLDGQQRITALYAVRKGVVFDKEGLETDFRRISIDLSAEPDSTERVVGVEPPEGKPSISVHELLNAGVSKLAQDYGPHLEKIDVYRSRLTGYDFSTIVMDEYPMDVACEVFVRINTGGTRLTLFEIMVAKTYDEDREFDLAAEYAYLLNNNGAEKDLEDVGYDTIPEATVLQCIAAHISGQVRAKDILRLGRDTVIEAWPTVKDGIFTAVDYLRGHLRIPVSLLLPYDALLVPLTYFFTRNKGREPTPEQTGWLVQYFWWASLSRRFSSGVEGKLLQDFHRMDLILRDAAPSYEGEEVHLTLDDLKGRWFSTGDSLSKAILCLYAYFLPQRFDCADLLVRLDNSWLKVASSRNYHHFFPKSRLVKADCDVGLANSVLNITLVDDYLNKRRIGTKMPSTYMKEFQAGNPKLEETMKTHLIDDLRGYGVWTDNYEVFLERRGARVLEELKERMGSALRVED